MNKIHILIIAVVITFSILIYYLYPVIINQPSDKETTITSETSTYTTTTTPYTTSHTPIEYYLLYKPRDAYFEFTIDFMHRLGFGDRNKVASPLSIYITLLMLAEAVEGDARSELLKAMYLRDLGEARQWFKHVLEDVTSVEYPAKLNLVNSVWVHYKYHVTSTYESIITDIYQGEIKYVNFADNEKLVEIINEWVRNKTNGLIDGIVDYIDPADRIIFINAMYFYGPWKDSFPEVILSEFHSYNKILNVYYLVGEQSVKLLKADEYIALSLEYKGCDLEFVVIMPKNGDLKDFISKLGRNKLLEIFEELLKKNETVVNLHLPQFDIDSGIIRLDKVLRDMGVEKIFVFSNLKPMLEEYHEELFVSRVLHRARVGVDQWGTEAASATGVVVTLGISEAPNLWINKPFLFFIVDPDTYTILFMGSVVEPLTQQSS